MIAVPMTVSASGVQIGMNVASSGLIPVKVAAAYTVSGTPYHGEYEFTPGDEAQTVLTKDKVLSQNITINAIPSNYGKVSWDGAIINIE